MCLVFLIIRLLSGPVRSNYHKEQRVQVTPRSPLTSGWYCFHSEGTKLWTVWYSTGTSYTCRSTSLPSPSFFSSWQGEEKRIKMKHFWILTKYSNWLWVRVDLQAFNHNSLFLSLVLRCHWRVQFSVTWRTSCHEMWLKASGMTNKLDANLKYVKTKDNYNMSSSTVLVLFIYTV